MTTPSPASKRALGHAVLDVLAPPAGMRTDLCIGATYSLDLVVLAAMITSLGGAHQADLARSRAVFAEAVTGLADRVRVVVHPGRVHMPRAPGPQHSLLDRFVVEAPLPEGLPVSWHPKVLLVRFVSEDGEASPKWRFWVGSRNLALGASWEYGVWTESSAKGAVVAGIGEVARTIGLAAAWNPTELRTLVNELDTVQWEKRSEGAELRVVASRGANETAVLWEEHPGADETWIVSPFLSASYVKYLASQTASRPFHLVSTFLDLAKVARSSKAANVALASFESLHVVEPAVETAADGSTDKVDEDESEPRGLHAKARLDRIGKRWHVQLGSANATHLGAGLGGAANAECVVRLLVEKPTVDVLLEETVLRSARRIAITELPNPESAAPEVDAETELEDVREGLSRGWHLRQVWEGGACRLEGGAPDVGDRIAVRIAPIAAAAWTPWPAGAGAIDVLSPPAEHARSRWVRVELRRTDLADVRLSFILPTALKPERSEEDDLRILAGTLGARGLQSWLLALLRGGAEADDPWDKPRDGTGDGSGPAGGGSVSEVPTVEEAMALYARKDGAARIKDVDNRIRTVRRVLGQLQLAEHESAVLREELDQFVAFWGSVRSVLGRRP